MDALMAQSPAGVNNGVTAGVRYPSTVAGARLTMIGLSSESNFAYIMRTLLYDDRCAIFA